MRWSLRSVNGVLGKEGICICHQTIDNPHLHALRGIGNSIRRTTTNQLSVDTDNLCEVIVRNSANVRAR